MFKRIIFITVIISGAIFLSYRFDVVALDSNNNSIAEAKLSKIFLTESYNSENYVYETESNITSGKVLNLHYSLINPFIETKAVNYPNYSIEQNIPDNHINDKNSRTYANDESDGIISYQNLNTSSFTCPESYQFAIDYKLTSEESFIYGRGYRNACAFSGGHRAFGDLLHGDNQLSDCEGDYNKLSAFIPYENVEGCKEDDFKVSLDATSDFNNVHKIINHETGLSIGYETESVTKSYVATNCNNYC